MNTVLISQNSEVFWKFHCKMKILQAENSVNSTKHHSLATQCSAEGRTCPFIILVLTKNCQESVDPYH